MTRELSIIRVTSTDIYLLGSYESIEKINQQTILRPHNWQLVNILIHIT